MRTFVALNLRPDLRAALHAAGAPLREAVGRAVSWTAADALHVTLKFLGERPDAFADDLASRLRAPVGREPAFDLRLGGVGAFPSLARPRILWVGVAANPTLARLYHHVEDASEALGAAREQRPFHPHVTLGRVRQGGRLDGRALARAAEAVGFRAVERVRSLDVMESLLGRGGARYRVAAAIPLGPGSESA